jgi:outer membrane protein assembly factor BamD
MGNSRLFFLPLLLVLTMLTACSEFSAVLKSDDYEYKYEVAKALYADGQYRQAAELFSMLLAPLKGTSYGEESLYMLAESNLKAKDYESAAMFFKKYYQVYPKGHYMEMARFNSGYSLYKQVADIRLDQTSTMEAIREYQDFLDYCPNTSLKEQTHAVIYELQDRLVEKEYLSAKLYYDLGTYTLNSIYGGNNYEACVVTAQNALKDYPYASAGLRENLSILILRAKYHLARQSVEAKRVERFRDAIDEYYAFENDFPESKYLKEANSIFRYSQRMVERKGGLLTDDDALVEKDGILEEAKEVKTKKQKNKEQKDS